MIQDKLKNTDMKIAYCLFGTYSTGGIERVTSVKMNWLASHGYEVYLITTGHFGKPSYFRLDERIKHIDLGLGYEEPGQINRLTIALRNRPRYKKHEAELNRLFNEIKPDIAVAAGWHEAEFLYRIKDGSKKVLERHGYLHYELAQHNLYYRVIEYPSLLDKLKHWTRLAFFKWVAYHKIDLACKFDCSVLLTERDRQGYKGLMNTAVIPNPITVFSEKKSPLTDKVVLAVGRLGIEKNFTELVEIWAMIAKDYPDWTLRIVGDGYEKEAICRAIRKYGLEAQVELLPFTNKIQEHYCGASVYAMTSVFESFGLVLVEAASIGLPLVAYDCPCGPSDIIKDGEDGFLIPMHDKEAYSKALRRLIEDESLRKRMGSNAEKNSERFSLDAVMHQWEELFVKLVGTR